MKKNFLKRKLKMGNRSYFTKSEKDFTLRSERQELTLPYSGLKKVIIVEQGINNGYFGFSYGNNINPYFKTLDAVSASFFDIKNGLQRICAEKGVELEFLSDVPSNRQPKSVVIDVEEVEEK